MPIAFLLRRIALAGPTLLGVALLVFVLIRIAPGDPIAMMVTGEATPDDIARLRAVYGLDHSIPVQFLIFLRDIATGHFGTSISLHRMCFRWCSSACRRHSNWPSRPCCFRWSAA
jgi:ABC-type dipeptide/oligopeptide/nickel transport system permease component